MTFKNFESHSPQRWMTFKIPKCTFIIYYYNLHHPWHQFCVGACTHEHIDPTYTKINTIGINYIVHLIVRCIVYCIAYCNQCPIFYSILSCSALWSSHSCTAHMGSRRPWKKLRSFKFSGATHICPPEELHNLCHTQHVVFITIMLHVEWLEINRMCAYICVMLWCSNMCVHVFIHCYICYCYTDTGLAGTTHHQHNLGML